MGRTKALIEIDGVAMGARVAAALRAAGCNRVVAYGGDPAELAALGLAVWPDRYPGAGPLGGVLGLLERLDAEAAAEAVIVAACDLPSLRGETLSTMVDALRAEPAAQVVVARTSQIEPTCAVWRVSAAGHLGEMYERGERALHVAIDLLQSVQIDVDPAALRNINTPGELGGYP